MSIILNMALVVFALSATDLEAAESFQETMRKVTASPKELTLRITDEDNIPVVGAKVDAVIHDIKTNAFTGDHPTSDEHGMAICRAGPNAFIDNVLIQVGEMDKRIGRSAYEFRITEHDFIDYLKISQRIDLTLPYIRRPIPLKARSQGITHKRMNGPAEAHPDPRLPDLAVTELGYDAELLEPVEPIGRGRRTDFTMRIESQFKGYKNDLAKRHAVTRFERGIGPMAEGQSLHGNWTHTVTFRFPNKGDGIVLSPQFWPYCKLQVPHKAPEQGYASELSLSGEQDPFATRPDLTACRKLMHNNGLFLRIRTQLDKEGNVVTANYAKILCPGVSRYAPMFSFNIFYNPTPNDRNLEYDFKTNLRWKELHPNSDATPTIGDYWLGSN